MRFWHEQRKFEKERIVIAEVPGSNPDQVSVDLDRGVVYMPEDIATGAATSVADPTDADDEQL
jgi:hypothetical protein